MTAPGYHHILRLFDAPESAAEGLSSLIASCYTVNSHLWTLEDRARMKKEQNGIASLKKEIDRCNQERNDLIHQIDLAAEKLLGNSPSDSGRFYAETPGMVIDRLAILCIKKKVMDRLVELIVEEEVREEYEAKQHRLFNQICDLGLFLDHYLSGVEGGLIYFKVYGPMKVYNDHRVRKYVERMMMTDAV